MGIIANDSFKFKIQKRLVLRFMNEKYTQSAKQNIATFMSHFSYIHFMKTLLTLLPFIMTCICSIAQKNITLASPDKRIQFHFTLTNSTPVYSVVFKGETVINNSTLELKFADSSVARNLRLLKPTYKDTTEEYDLLVGKTSHVVSHYKQVTIAMRDGAKRLINIEVKAFNDGLAFCYVFPEQDTWKSYDLLDENSTFNVANNPTIEALFFSNYTSSHEGVYQTLPLNKVAVDTLIDLPALFTLSNKTYVAITEAALVNYAGMYLSKHNNVLVSKLSPLPHEEGIKVKAVLPHRTPWRVMLISDTIGKLIESNIITTLNEPSKIKDLSWIKPGKTTFPWWNGNVVPDTINAPGNNFVTNQYYIDFCARNNIQYHSVVEYGLHQWYMDDGVGFQPGPHADVTTPVPGLDMKEVCDYAKSKGVGIRVWVHFYALYPRLDSAFAIFEKWGLEGMMVDFMDRDDQEMVNMQEEILQKAAAHHLHIQFHGAFKPTGLTRTYPNEFTREGTRNYEVDKWTREGLSPDHDITMPFTRMLAGATDYHLGGFRAATPQTFKLQYTRPMVLGTRCHMLAMYVVLESNLGMVCDYPEAYEGQPGFEFIKEVPTVWDETKVLNAEVNTYITIARRKGNNWYIGSINNHEARDIKMPLSFLDNGTYNATIYTDAKDVDTAPDNLNKDEKTVTKKDALQLHIAAGGGQVIRLVKIN